MVSMMTARTASFGFVILLSILLDIGAQLNIWRIVAVSEKKAQDIANQVLPGTWAVNGDSITLNLGGGRFAQVSRREYEFIKGHLNAIMC